MQPFLKLQQETLCPFARRSIIHVASSWNSDREYQGNIESIAGELRKALVTCRRERHQGFLATIPLTSNYSLTDAVSAFRSFVFALGECDEACGAKLKEDIGAIGWSFCFDGEPIFLNLFGSCYKRPHSKFVDDSFNFYVFFQPEFTFDFCNIDRSKRSIKIGIRESFADAGMPYDGETIDGRRKALSFVFPESVGLPPIKWWSEAYREHGLQSTRDS